MTESRNTTKKIARMALPLVTCSLLALAAVAGSVAPASASTAVKVIQETVSTALSTHSAEKKANEIADSSCIAWSCFP